MRRYRERHPERLAAAKKATTSKPEYRAWKRAWSASPEQRAKSKARKDAYRATPRGRLENRLRAALRRALSRGRGGASWEAVLGYTLADLQAHLERQFLKGMTWANAGDWHIDHIVPLSSFTFASDQDAEFKAAWSLSNLRPLWAEQNWQKTNKREVLL